MKNKTITIILACILLMIFALPVFAEDGSGQEEFREGEPLLLSEDQDKSEEGASEEGYAEVVPEEHCEDAEPEEETSEGGGITVVSAGKGRIEIDEDGFVTAVPSEGYEIASITADTDTGRIEAGKEIPEDILSGIEFGENTTITVIFERDECEPDCYSVPPSASAIF